MKQTEQEFSKLVRENKQTIYTVCYMFSKDTDEVADLFQEVLIRIWNGLASFDNKSSVTTWIYRIALNTCISLDKRKKKHKDAELSMSIDLFNDKSESSAQVRQLHKRISQLAPLDRAIVLLWLEDISYDEIAAIVGISAKNVSVRLFRIRQQLKNMSNE